jgi:hypothetical protein
MVVTKKEDAPNKPQTPIAPNDNTGLMVKSLMPPGKFEVTPDQTFDVIIYLKKYKGRWVLMESPAKDVEKHTIVFRMWNFEECLRLRRQSMSFDPQTRTNKLDNDRLNKQKIMLLMQDWSLSSENPRLEIHRANGVLTEASWKAFVNISPAIADKIIAEMNMVLDYGG